MPPGVTLFDAARWNCIAIDSTCGGHGTCKIRKVQIVEGAVPVSPPDSRAFKEPGGAFTVRAEVFEGDYVHVEVEDSGGPWQEQVHNNERPHGLDIVCMLAGD